MNIILLSGGSGKRLWPLSNDIRSKQFIRFFKDESSKPISMMERVYKQIISVDKDAVITVATSKTQVPAIHNQLGDDFDISIEPGRRDTFPAIALACAYLSDIKGVKDDEVTVVLPVDPYVDDNYFKSVKRLSNIMESSKENLMLMGIEPDSPSEKYGYIIPRDKEDITQVKSFKEKPSEDLARKYIAEGALWNAGVFAFKLGYVLDKARELLDYTTYRDLYDRYNTLRKISFDYAVVENEKSIGLLRFKGQWKDLGTWDTLSESMDERRIGKGIISEDSKNVHLVNELDIPVLVNDVRDLIVAAGPQGILVSSKEKSSAIKGYVEKFDDSVMFAEESFGDYRVVDKDDDTELKKINIKKDKCFKLSASNSLRKLIVTKGSGNIISDSKKETINVTESLEIKKGEETKIKASTDMKIILIEF